MKYVLSGRSKPLTVYTSAREPVTIAPGGVLETNDEKLIARLGADPLFSEVKPSPSSASVDYPIEHFVTEPPKKRGRPKKVVHDADGA